MKHIKPVVLIWLPFLAVLVSSMALYNVRFVELNDSRMVATSDYNYAVTSPKLLVKNWRSVSVNGDNVLIVTTTGQKIPSSRTTLGDQDMGLIEGVRNEIGNSNGGYSHVTSTGGLVGGSSFTTSTSGGSSSSFSSSTSGQFSLANGLNRKDLSVNMRDENNFSVSRSDFPFNWSTVFFNGDFVTFVYRDGQVHMLTMLALEPDQLDSINRLKQEVKEMQRAQTRQLTNTIQQSADMVSNVFSNIMGTFPKPPDYRAAVGDMFGDSFPFGPKNSPFSAAAGWPFSGNGPFAGAFVGPF